MLPEHQRERIEMEDVGDAVKFIFLDKEIVSAQNIQIIVGQLHSLVDEQEKRKVILDFRNVEHLSTAMFGRFITLQKKMNAACRKLVLCSIAPEIYKVFEITKLNRLFIIAKNEEEAMEMIK